MTADQAPVTSIMSCNVVCARKEQPLGGFVEHILRDHIGCIPVIDEKRHPRGIVTKTDLVELLGKPDQIAAATVGDVMMPLAIVLDDHATVAQCATMMALEDFHHVMIVASDGTLVGIVSSQDIVRWMVANAS